jgi:sec-independent protein translocase protein TatC
MSDAEPSRPGEAAQEPENEVKAGFMEHLQELRTRLLHAILGIVVGSVAVGAYAERIFRWVMEPVIRSLPEGHRALHFTSYLV